MNIHWHRAHGLLLRSTLELPEFAAARPGRADIAVTMGGEARLAWLGLGDATPGQGAFAAAPVGGHVMHVDSAGHYWVRGGTEIFVSQAPGADGATVRLFLLGSALGMAFHQRGMLVLHGATVRHDGAATIFVGHSGGGKSTLAAAFGKAGLPILGDDTVLLWPRPGGGFEVWPGSRMFKLWCDAIEALGGDAAGLVSVGDRLDKYFVPNDSAAPDRPVPVRRVVALAAADDGPAELARVVGLDAIRVIAGNTYRPEYVPLLAREASHFRLCSALAGSVAVSRLRRPWDMGRLDETLALLDRHWSGPAAAASPR